MEHARVPGAHTAQTYIAQVSEVTHPHTHSNQRPSAACIPPLSLSLCRVCRGVDATHNTTVTAFLKGKSSSQHSSRTHNSPPDQHTNTHPRYCCCCCVSCVINQNGQRPPVLVWVLVPLCGRPSLAPVPEGGRPRWCHRASPAPPSYTPWPRRHRHSTPPSWQDLHMTDSR